MSRFDDVDADDVTDGLDDVTTVESGNGEEGSMTGMFLSMFAVVDDDADVNDVVVVVVQELWS